MFEKNVYVASILHMKSRLDIAYQFFFHINRNYSKDKQISFHFWLI